MFYDQGGKFAFNILGGSREVVVLYVTKVVEK